VSVSGVGFGEREPRGDGTYRRTYVHEEDGVLDHLGEDDCSVGSFHLDDWRSGLCVISGLDQALLLEFLCSVNELEVDRFRRTTLAC
jgi:hypothetical protein